MSQVEARLSRSLSSSQEVDVQLLPEREIVRTLSAPVSVQWELTSYCNEKCIHCYNYWLRSSGEEKLRITPETLALYDRASSEIVKNKVFHVTLTGGEPLAVLKWVYPYLQRLKDNGVDFSFNTNLTMLTEEKVRVLRSLGVRSLLTSLISSDSLLNDEMANRPNTYKDVSKGIRLAVREGFWVGVNMVVSRKNIHNIYDTAEYVKSLGVSDFSATKASTPASNVGFEQYALSADEVRLMVNELLRIQKNLGLRTDSLEFYPMCVFDSQESRDFAAGHACNAGKSGCTIGFDGQVRPCSHAGQMYGSVMSEGGLKGAWENLQPWRTDAYIPDECSSCQYNYVCRGGCRSEAFVVNGNLKAPDPYSDFSRRVFPSTPPEGRGIDPSAKFEFKPGVRARSESFGGVLYASPTKWTGVTPELTHFYEDNKTAGFQLSDLAMSLGVDKLESAANTAGFLINKNIIRERR